LAELDKASGEAKLALNKVVSKLHAKLELASSEAIT